MKTIYKLVPILVLLFSCSDVKLSDYIYDNYGNTGANILNKDSIYFVGFATKTYSLRAKIPNTGKLKIIIHNLSDPKKPCPANDTCLYDFQDNIWYFRVGSNTNIIINTYDFNLKKQEFIAENQGIAETSIQFAGSGKAKIEYFENFNSVATKTKLIYWGVKPIE